VCRWLQLVEEKSNRELVESESDARRHGCKHVGERGLERSIVHLKGEQPRVHIHMHAYHITLLQEWRPVLVTLHASVGE
jgi:hypothetical protein